MRTTIRHTILAAVVAVAAGVPGVASADSPQLKAPVVHEPFTPLACSGAPASRSTVQMEGCLEHQLLDRDSTINALNAKVFDRLRLVSAKRSFITSNTRWLSYRKAFCSTDASRYAGGTLVGVAALQCEATIDSGHITDLRDLLADVSFH